MSSIRFRDVFCTCFNFYVIFNQNVISSRRIWSKEIAAMQVMICCRLAGAEHPLSPTGDGASTVVETPLVDVGSGEQANGDRAEDAPDASAETARDRVAEPAGVHAQTTGSRDTRCKRRHSLEN